jgi:hypothetical protein
MELTIEAVPSPHALLKHSNWLNAAGFIALQQAVLPIRTDPRHVLGSRLCAHDPADKHEDDRLPQYRESHLHTASQATVSSVFSESQVLHEV